MAQALEMTSPPLCDICGSTSSRLLFDRARDGEVLQRLCTQCGMIFVSPRPTTTATADIYSSGAFSMQARGTRQPSSRKIQQTERAALRRFHLLNDTINLLALPAGSLLEIGCGIGSFLRLMRGLGWSVEGLEPDPDYSAFGSNAFALAIQDQLYEGVPYAAESFDMIASFHVIEHVSSPHAHLAKAYAELKPDGLLWIETPTIERARLGNLEQFFWSAHLSTFSHNTLRGLLQHIGFAPVAEGFLDDALWIVARKTPASQPLSLPLDDPDARYQHVHQAYLRYRLAQSTPISRLAWKGYALARRVHRSWQEDPRATGYTLLNHGYRLRQRISAAPLLHRALRQHPVAHVGFHVPGNAGDTVLFKTVRDLFDRLEPHSWALESVTEEVTPAKVAHWNEQAGALLIGGGGLFLRDTNANSKSDWIWPCATDDLRQINPPIVVFAVGYNRFRGQEEFEARFTENVTELVRCAGFVGLRTLGSIDHLRSYLPADLQAKVVYQPCPTTMLPHIYPAFMRRQQRSPRRLALNVAADRAYLRFQGQEDRILNDLARVMKWAQEQGWQIDLVLHMKIDELPMPWLHRHNVAFRVVNLARAPAWQVLTYYRDTPLAIGMRTHSQLLPFGAGNAIISLVTHPKMAWFLADIGHPEWGIDMGAPDFAERLQQSIAGVADDIEATWQQVAQARQQLWEITQTNMQQILPLLRSQTRG